MINVKEMTFLENEVIIKVTVAAAKAITHLAVKN